MLIMHSLRSNDLYFHVYLVVEVGVDAHTILSQGMEHVAELLPLHVL